jgi:PAS domain S-box-containing protein
MNKDVDIYKLLFDTAGEGLVVIDGKGFIELVNPRITQMFGYSKEELIGERIEFLVPDSVKKIHEHYRIKYTKSPVHRSMGINLDLAGQRKDKSLFPLEISLNYLQTDGETIIIGLISDITKRVEAQNKMKELNVELEHRVNDRTKELQKSEKLYKLIARNFPKGTINVFDKDLKYVFAEGQELDAYGVVGEKLIGRSYTDRFEKDLGLSIREKFNRVFNGESISFEFEDKENSYVINAVPLKSESGEVEQILVIEKNITDDKLAEVEMRKNLEKEKELTELKSRFLSMASHEFRTPLSTILSSTTLIEKYDALEHREKKEKHLKRIKTSVKNLTSILNDFLSLDKLEEGKNEITKTEFSLIKLIEEAKEELEPYLKEEQEIVIVNNLVIDRIVCDRNIIKNILINLLSNASKYSDEGKKITLSLLEVAEGIELQFKDSGIGIPEEDQKRLFERFFRAKNVTNIQGTGLGLNIVKRYVDLIQGKIRFISKENIGTTFTVTIPNLGL